MDVAAATIAYLDANTSIQWYHNAPVKAPAEYGTITRDGGPTEIVRDLPTVTLLVHAGTRGRAEALASEAMRALFDMPYAEDNVFRAEVMGHYYDPLDKEHPRVRVTASLLVND